MAVKDLLEQQRQYLEEAQMISRWNPQKNESVYAEIIDLNYSAKTQHSESGYKPSILFETIKGLEMYIFRNYFIDLILDKHPIVEGQKVIIEFFGKKKVNELRYNTYGIIQLSDEDWESGMSSVMNRSTGDED